MIYDIKTPIFGEFSFKVAKDSIIEAFELNHKLLDFHRENSQYQTY